MLHSSDFMAKSTSYQCFHSSYLGYIRGIHSLKKKKNPFITNAVVAQTGEGLIQYVVEGMGPNLPSACAAYGRSNYVIT